MSYRKPRTKVDTSVYYRPCQECGQEIHWSATFTVGVDHPDSNLKYVRVCSDCRDAVKAEKALKRSTL